jgi:hypothetical protein
MGEVSFFMACGPEVPVPFLTMLKAEAANPFKSFWTRSITKTYSEAVTFLAFWEDPKLFNSSFIEGFGTLTVTLSKNQIVLAKDQAA